MVERRELAPEEDERRTVLGEALRERVPGERGEGPREQVLAHLQASVERHRELYRGLA